VPWVEVCEARVLVTDGCEERVVAMIESDGNAPAAGFVDE
jgi:hypothetical protein